MDIFSQQLINGLTYGSLLGFIALGYTMVYGILNLINFAHGDMVTLAAFLAITIAPLAVAAGTLAMIITLAAVVVSVCIIAILLEKIAYKPLRAAPRLSLIVSALGAGMVIKNAIMLIWGANPRIFPRNLFPAGLAKFSDISVSYLSVIILLLNILVMLTLYIFINKTRVGIAIKALSTDYSVAELMGVNVNNTVMIVFLIGGGVGALGGMLIGASYTTVTFSMGFDYGIKAFIAAILGGIGSIPGAMFGGLLLGLTYTFCSGYVSSAWANTVTYLLLIILLIFRPNGLFGRSLVQKV
ncbi:MAG: branched-chain amino acid ABC transporter permease [Deferribacteraceae bacterium]|jgi:branched-chain amino acid transport system permease protein|nr:branched-chain amino acid ABC transporter permease [Deferribacteraceae bacterium]